MAKSPDAFRTISEVADWLGIQAHVLRFWESKFTQVKPIKRAGGRRYYRPTDMLLLGGIKKLLHDDGLTIKGVQKILREEGMNHVSDLSDPLDELTLTELGETAAPKTPAPLTPPTKVAEEKGIVLNFDPAAIEEEQSRSSVTIDFTPEPDTVDDAPAENAALPPEAVASSEAVAPSEPVAPPAPTATADPIATPDPVVPLEPVAPPPVAEEEVAPPHPPESHAPTASPDPLGTDATEDAPQLADINAPPDDASAPDTSAESDKTVSDDTPAADITDVSPEPEFPADDTPDDATPVPSNDLPAFLRQPLGEEPVQPETPDTTSLDEEALERPPVPLADEPDMSEQEPAAAETAAPKPRIVDMPPLAAQSDVPTQPSALTFASQARALPPAHVPQVAVLLQQLAALRDQMASHRGSGPASKR